ncbi:hypothetical protein OROHE_002964 [Orobanche hederae]
MELDKTTEACFLVDDDLLNFTLDDGEGEEEVDPTIFKGGASVSSSSMESSNPAAATASFVRGTQTGSFPESVEEELEWLSNKDAFPAVETCFGILSDNPELIPNHQSPISVLENSNTNSIGSSVASCPTNYPVGARAKRRRRTAGFGDLLPSRRCSRPAHAKNAVRNEREFSLSQSPPAPVPMMTQGGGVMGRRCLHCQTDKTPQWRAGPMGPKTLCNACGVRYKSGRLFPEYRPASSPTFSSVQHSNSHRKVVEMRRQKQMGVDISVG